jgi:hypothetical protein
MKTIITVVALLSVLFMPAAQAIIVPHVVKGVLVLAPLMAKYSTPPAKQCYETKSVKDGNGTPTNAVSTSEVSCS